MRTLRDLGLPDHDLMSSEVQAELLRRVASFRSPATPRALVADVIESVEWLVDDPDELREGLRESLDLLVGYGDLIEGTFDEAFGTRRLLFLAPPTFVPRKALPFFLTGVRPDGVPLLSGSLAARIVHRGHLRLITPLEDEDLKTSLADDDLRELSMDRWIASPRQVTPSDCVDYYRDRFVVAHQPIPIDGVRVIDTAQPVTFYKGRWRELAQTDDGFFVARRPQAYGSDLWCVLLAERGGVVSLLDLPVMEPGGKAADEAWRIQAAEDALRGNPQVVRVIRNSDTGDDRIVFYSPIPSWAQRRLDAVGTPRPAIRSGLFAYDMPATAIEAEVSFLGQMMWIDIRDDGEHAEL